jgi:DNA-binding beta-propeller fold protein YncE
MHRFSPSLRGPLCFASLAALALLLHQGVQAGDDSEPKLPPPGKEALAKALDEVKSLYKKEIAEAKDDTAAGKALAATLLKEGKNTPGKEEAALRFAAISLARDVASQAGDHPTAMEAIEELARGFTVDTLPMKADALAAAAKSTESKEDNQNLAELALQILEEAVHSDSYEAALSLADTAGKAAARAKSLKLAARAKKVEEDIRATQKEFERVQPFLTKLAKNADDKDANLEAGKYYCFLKNNWTKGLPYLTKSGDQSLKSLAEKDLAKPKLAKKQVELADAWAALGDKEKGPARKGLLRRAHHWYTEALSDSEALVGLTRVRVQRRAEEIAKEFPEGPSYIVALANLTMELRRMEGGLPNPQVLDVTADGKLALIGNGNDGQARLLDVKTGKVLKTLTGGPFGGMYGIAISADGKLGATGVGAQITLWDLKTGQQLRTLNGHTDTIRGLHFLPGGKQLVSTSNDRTVRIWDVSNGTMLKNMTGHTGLVNVMAVSKDGRKAITTSHDQTARVWDLKTGTEAMKLSGHTNIVWGAALSPDGKTAITSGYDGTVRVWDTKSGKELRRLDCSGVTVLSVAFAPDGKRALTGSGGFGGMNPADSSIRLWDVATGKLIRKLDGHTNGVRWLAFSGDGRVALSAGGDNTVRVWGSK